MLIRGETVEVLGEAALVAGPTTTSPALLPSLILGGILLLIGP